jgi:hypothetical protein
MAPIWNQTPLDQIKRTLTGLLVLPDDEQFLTWRRIVATRDIFPSSISIPIDYSAKPLKTNLPVHLNR